MRLIISMVMLSVMLLASDTVKIASLEWQDNTEAKTIKLNWQDAKDHCQNLSLGGYEDWRLPNIKELQSIVDTKHYKPTIKSSFVYTASSDYWSSGEDVSDAKYAWHVHFNKGLTDYDAKSYEYSVRCVRARQ